MVLRHDDHSRTPLPAFPLNLRDFGWRRIKRLYPPFFVAVLLTIGLDWLMAHVNAAYYAGATDYGTVWHLMIYSDPKSYHPARLIGNLLMQPGVLASSIGTNVSLWSLGYEVMTSPPTMSPIHGDTASICASAPSQ